MLTDDDLTRELAAAFRDETTDLRYAGRKPRLRRTVPLSAIPVAAAAAAIVIVPQVAGDDAAAPRPPSTSSSAPSVGLAPSIAATPKGTPTSTLTLHKVHLAGFTFETTRQITEDDPLVFTIDATVPAAAKTVDGVPEFVQTWVGTDQKTGNPAVWVKTGNGTGPHLFEAYAFHGDWTADELIQLIKSPA
jgi:hypothetical protein